MTYYVQILSPAICRRVKQSPISVTVRMPDGESEFMQENIEKMESGVCLLSDTHTHAEPEGKQDPACSSTCSVTKPVEFAYLPSCHLREKGQPHPALACGDSRVLQQTYSFGSQACLHADVVYTTKQKIQA